MTLPKLISCPARLAELALANGWPADEVANTFGAIVGPVCVSDAKPLTAPRTGNGSKALRDEFVRLAAGKR